MSGNDVIRIALAGAGAFGIKHLDGLQLIDGVEVTSLVDVSRQDARRSPRVRHRSRHHRARREPRPRRRRRRHPVHADARCTPARRSPVSTRASTSRSRSRCATRSPTARRWSRSSVRPVSWRWCGHTRRFNPSHQWVRTRITAGDSHPADGCADVLLPAHQHQRARASRAAGPITCCGTTRRTPSTCSSTRPAAPWCRRTRSRGRSIPSSASRWTCRSSSRPTRARSCTLSLSFNNDGPFGTFFRYIGDSGTYIARYDDLFDGNDEPIDVSGVACR
jgi:2-hydroxy-4-carboxymuconate semialdehyde hemiacetal dehydrogenase